MPRPRLAALLVVVIAVSACAGTARTPAPGAATASPAASTDATGSADASALDESPAATPEPTDEPGATEDQATTDEPVATDEPAASPSADATGDVTATPGIAAACTGSAKNREFYVSVANAVSWPVYCAVLPSGWFVSTGSYRLASGGKLLISYKGPGGATIALSEGAFCQAADGCVPSGTDAGAARFGGRAGTLVALDDGGFAVVADRGTSPSWLLVSSGLSQAETSSIAGALVEVAD